MLAQIIAETALTSMQWPGAIAVAAVSFAIAAVAVALVNHS